jgi:FlaA1/EpsC-like NDP-sugar epimerase
MINASFLIIGGTGTVGSYLVKKLSEEGVKNIIVFSRNEYMQYLLKLKYPNAKYIIGDIFNYDRINEAMQNVDYVIHTAAMKHVNIAEDNPVETINTNILGSLNVVNASIHHKVKKVIFISTDKSNNANCLYGSTKYISDKLCLNANKRSSNTIFSIVRFGNIFGSRGSIIEKFTEIAKTSNRFPITSLKSTRCFVTLDTIYDLVKFTLENMEGGEIFIPKMKSVFIKDIPKLIRDDSEIKIISFQKFEKLHEDIITDNDLDSLYETDSYYIITDNADKYTISELKQSINSSQCEMLTKEEFNQMYSLFLYNLS